MPDLTAGEVDLDLGGERYVLRPTIRAALDLSRKFKGFHPVEVALVMRDMDAFVAVIMAGCGLPQTERQAIEAKVYAAGLVAQPKDHNPALLDPLLEYLTVLQNGGRPLPKEDPEQGEATGV